MRRILVIGAIACAACGGGDGDSFRSIRITATPSLSVASGTYANPISVAVATTTVGATIRYTTDGTTPTGASAAYAGPIAISTATTLKAIALAVGRDPSDVATGVYAFQAAPPTFSVAPGTYATEQSVALATATNGATIHFTLDGADPTLASSAYSTPIVLPVGGSPSTTTIRAIAARPGFTASAIAAATYTIEAAATPAADPEFAPTGGTYTSVQSVAITSATAAATIHFTEDGSDPTVASSVYSAPIEVGSSRTLKAFARAPGHTDSRIVAAVYLIELPPAATPTFSPAAGSFGSAQSVTIASTTPGAVVRYTTDGATPTPGSPTASSPISVAVTRTLRATATAAGYAPSVVATATYVIAAGAGGGTDFTSVCNSILAAKATLYATCFELNPAGFTVPGTFPSKECAATQVEIAAGRIAYDEAQGAACAGAWASLTCSALYSGFGFASPPSCLAALTGQVATDGTCYMDGDCADGFCSSETEHVCPGVCRPRAGPGAPCGPLQRCANDLACTFPATPSTCVTPGALDEACPCRPEYYCDTTGASGVCKVPKTSGPCSGTDIGECAVGYACVTSGVGQGATCVALAGVGEGCAGSPCGSGYYCLDVCRAWPTSDESCADTGVCIGAYCDTGNDTCVTYKEGGAPCASSLECESGSCDQAGTCAPLACRP